MKNTFLNRVSAERKILKVVNSGLPSDKRLAGLSQGALFRWRAQIGYDRVADVLPLLTDLADRCQRLSDRSHETFMPIEAEQGAEIEHRLETLERELNRCR